MPAVSQSTVPMPRIRSSGRCDTFTFCTRLSCVECSCREIQPVRMWMRRSVMLYRVVARFTQPPM